MAEQYDTLIKCFAAVFPDVTAERIPEASINNLTQWDSLATVTLVALIEQEFEVQIDIIDLPKFTSFTAIKEYLEKQNLLSK